MTVKCVPSEQTESKPKTQIKTVKILQVKEIEGGNFRKALRQGTVQKIIDLIENGEADSIPPLEVFRLQTGDPDYVQYILYNGHHRFEAFKQASKKKEVRVQIRGDKEFIPDDLDTKEVRRVTLLSAMDAHYKSDSPPDYDELRQAVRDLFSLGTDIEDLTKYASRPAVFNWTKDLRESKKEGKKRLCQELKSQQGLSEREIADRLNIPRSTVNRLLSEDKVAQKSTVDFWATSADGFKVGPDDTQPNDNSAKSEIRAIESETSATPDDGKNSGKGGSANSEAGKEPRPKPTTEELQGKILAHLKSATEIQATLRRSSSQTDDYVLNHLVPVFCVKSTKIEGSLKAKKYVAHIHSQAEKVDTLQADLNKANDQNFMLKETLAEAKNRLKEREKHCSTSCGYSLELFEKVYLDDLRTHVEDFELLARMIVKTPRDKNLKALATRFLSRELSYLGWGKSKGFTSKKLFELFERLEKKVDEMPEAVSFSPGMMKSLHLTKAALKAGRS